MREGWRITAASPRIRIESASARARGQTRSACREPDGPQHVSGTEVSVATQALTGFVRGVVLRSTRDATHQR